MPRTGLWPSILSPMLLSKANICGVRSSRLRRIAPRSLRSAREELSGMIESRSRQKEG